MLFGAHHRRGPVDAVRRSLQVILVVSLCAAVAACSGSDASVTAAQANVAAKERALTKAQADAASATKSYCSAAATYITAIDRYGDVLNATAPTVGDVVVAGKDLRAPRADAQSSAEDAMAAQEAVTQAQQDLDDANAHLAAVQASSTGGTPPPTASPTSSPNPVVPTETVARVQQAEDDFAAAQRGITRDTPLSAASVQFNSAAVALEMAWLQLFSQSGCLTDEQQKAATQAVSEYTTALQKDLATAGYYSGTADGVYGPETVAAVEALQKAHGLPVTGAVDKATAAALQSDLAAKGGAATQASVASTAALQQTLKLAGYWDGPVDGQWTPELTDALKEFQTALGVPATGTVDSATIAAFEKQLEGTQSPTPTATPTPSTPSEKPSTAAPSPSTSAT